MSQAPAIIFWKNGYQGKGGIKSEYAFDKCQGLVNFIMKVQDRDKVRVIGLSVENDTIELLCEPMIEE